MNNSSDERDASWLIERHFVGDAFEDSLFNEQNQRRETACAWKIMSTSRHFGDLANGSWQWKAIGIPLSMFDKQLQGDIDLLIAMRPAPVMQEGRRIFPPPVYRCFELKAAKVKQDGTAKALKLGEQKVRSIKGQLDKLIDAGAQQVFLLEVFSVEAGYSASATGRMPDQVRDAIAHKLAEIQEADYGYVTMAIEQIPGFDESATGVAWPVATIKPAGIQEQTGAIRDIVEAIDSYATTAGARTYGAVITYCYTCKKLTHTQRTGPYFCSDCGQPFIPN